MAHSVKVSASMPNDWTLVPGTHIEGEHWLLSVFCFPPVLSKALVSLELDMGIGK